MKYRGNEPNIDTWLWQSLQLTSSCALKEEKMEILLKDVSLQTITGSESLLSGDLDEMLEGPPVR